MEGETDPPADSLKPIRANVSSQSNLPDSLPNMWTLCIFHPPWAITISLPGDRAWANRPSLPRVGACLVSSLLSQSGYREIETSFRRP